AETATPTMPQVPLGSPSPSTFSQLSPPSVERLSWLPGPPLSKLHGRRITCQKPAYRTRGFVGSIASSEAPVLSSSYATLSQLLPPSVERNTPRSALGPKAWPCTAT